MAASQAGNPFSPAFGSTPPLLAGRDDVLGRFAEAAQAGPLHPDYTLLLTGERGSGKTALLNALEADAAARGWPVIAVASTSESVAARVARDTAVLLERIRSSGSARLTSLNVLGIGLAWERRTAADHGNPDLASTLEQLGRLLRDHDSGLLLTVDELHDVERDDVRDIAGALQMVTRRRLCPVAFVGAALPLIAHTHLADPGMTFFQRCARAPLGPLDAADTRRALLEPILAASGSIDADALDEAVAATLGYPYMIQLVGYWAWRIGSDLAGPISHSTAQAAIAEAERTMIEQIARPVWNRLSPMDKRFLTAMLDDDGDSSLEDVARRIGRSIQFARTYRSRLVGADAVESGGRGRVRFKHRAMRACASARRHDDLDLLDD
ncbi:MAG: ATP-binding protein [Acidimicrobiaceae bacterium]|nr:ATP-binding protein [Acidimicrobiaceae bacterium]